MGSVQAAFGVAASDNSTVFHQAFLRATFLASHQRIFSVLFWFVVLGPFGAVLYRLIESVNTQMLTGATLAGRVKALLDWIPVRLEAFLFALGGHFTAVFACWKRDVLSGPRYNDKILTECGM